MHNRWIDDGHKLIVKLGPDWTIKPDILCTPATCKAKWHLDSKPLDAAPCWLQYVCQEVGSEFLEWWTTSEGGNVREVELTAGQVTIEWYAEGGEEGATWWRPVEPDRHEAADPRMVMAVAA